MWFLYALASAIFASVRKTSEKQLSHQLNHFTIGWMVQLFALPILLVMLLVEGSIFNPLYLGLDFWLPTILVWVGFYPINTFLYINALKHGELSKVVPLISLGPVISLLFGLLFLGQIPSLLSVVAICVIVTGVYVLNAKGQYLHKANVYTLLGLIMVAIAGVLDTWAINASSAAYYSFVSTFGAVCVLYVSARIFGVKEVSQLKKHGRALVVAGTLFGASYGTYVVALASGPLAYVTAVRNSGALLCGTLIGFFALKEAITRQKLVALLIILSGLALLLAGE